ncbi:MAG: S24/S26 family peptidase [Candidatus Omnitrophota bacterium]
MQEAACAKVLTAMLKGRLEESRTLTLKVVSGSMRPWINPGDAVIIEPVRLCGLGRGDIILYHHNGRLFCHRLVQIKSEGRHFLLAKADWGFSPAAYIDSAALLGRVARIEKPTFILDCNSLFWRAMNKLAGLLALGEENFSFSPTLKRVIRLPVFFFQGVMAFILKLADFCTSFSI